VKSIYYYYEAPHFEGPFSFQEECKMRIFKTQQDFDVLRHTVALPAALLEQVESYFNQLMVELGDEAESEFRLDRYGYIVVLEAGDNVRDLGNVGLSRFGGLLGSCPEYVELLDIGEGLHAYKIAVLYDNDYLMTFFTQVGAHDEGVEQWLKDQAGRNWQ
jgi:hypothetical protein